LREAAGLAAPAPAPAPAAAATAPAAPPKGKGKGKTKKAADEEEEAAPAPAPAPKPAPAPAKGKTKKADDEEEAAPAPAPAPAPAGSRQESVQTAAGLRRKVGELRAGNAGWPEIWAALNPDGDALTQELLMEIRGPHLFAPHVALNVIEDGCRRALRRDAGASRVAALRAALRGSERITGGD
jgi:hypothetical protein